MKHIHYHGAHGHTWNTLYDAFSIKHMKDDMLYPNKKLNLN